MKTTTYIELTADELKTIEGGGGGTMDPDGNPTTSEEGDTGSCIDPNG